MNFLDRLAQRAPATITSGGGGDTAGPSRVELPSGFVVVNCPFNVAELSTMPAAQALVDELNASDFSHFVALRDMHDELM